MIEFSKSGRKLNAAPAPAKKEPSYTKKELRVYDNLVVAVAVAVIQQWSYDGKPQEDLPMIKIWEGILKEGLTYGSGSITWGYR